MNNSNYMKDLGKGVMFILCWVGTFFCVLPIAIILFIKWFGRWVNFLISVFGGA